MSNNNNKTESQTPKNSSHPMQDIEKESVFPKEFERFQYHEKQNLAFCALHSANNILQEKVYTKKDFDEFSRELAKTSAPSSMVNPHKSIFGIGNYDANVLIYALQKQNLKVVWFDSRKDLQTINLDEVFAIIINTTSSHFFSIWRTKHWFALRKFGSLWWNLDSELGSPTSFENEEALRTFFGTVQKDKKAELLLVYTRSEKSQDSQEEKRNSK